MARVCAGTRNLDPEGDPAGWPEIDCPATGKEDPGVEEADSALSLDEVGKRHHAE